MNPINHAHVVNEINQTNQTNERSHTSRTHAGDQTNQTNQTNLLRLGSPTRDAIWKVQGYGLVLITFLSVFPILFHLEEYLFFTLLTIALAVAWLDGRQIWVRTPIDLPLLLFVGWVLLTVPFAIDPAYSFAEWRKLVAQVLVFYWALLVLGTQPTGLVTRGVLGAVVIGTAILCAYALVDFVAQGGSWKDRYVRARALGSDSNWLGTYMVIVIPIVASAAVIMKERWQRLACYSGVTLPALFTLVLSYMRAAWLGLLVEVIAFVVVTGRRRFAMWLIGCCILGVLGLLALDQVGYQQDTFSPVTLKLRLAVWQLGIGEVVHHPLVGIGYGNDTFEKRFKDYLETAPEPVPGTGWLRSTHNAFLMVGMGSGLPALILLIWVLVSAVRSLLYGATKVSDGKRYGLMIGIALVIIGFTTRNLFDYMLAGSLAYLFWILVAIGMAEVIKARKNHQAEERTGLAVAATQCP